MAIAALITWIITALFGAYMLRTWAANGGLQGSAAGGGTSHFPPPVVFGHFLLAAAGLVVWIIYIVNDNDTLAWVAFADLLVVAILGDLLVFRWAKDRKGGADTAAVGRVSGSAAGSMEATGAAGAPAALAEQRIPAAAVGLHGLFAVATVVLVLLSALEIGT